jgi:hypothetical protein
MASTDGRWPRAGRAHPAASPHAATRPQRDDRLLARLATANHLPPTALRTYLRAAPGQRTQTLLQRIAAASRQPPASLFHALVELQYLDTSPLTYRTTFPRAWNGHGVALPACQPCMASRGITATAIVFIPSHHQVCLHRGRWLGQRQLDLVNAPEIIQAHRQRRWIARRLGRHNANDGFGVAADIVGRWLRRGDLSALQHNRWEPRLTRLGETRRSLDFDDPMLLAATYPETVALGSILASPYWIAMAASGHAVDRNGFHQETARRLGVSNLGVLDQWDPLRRWQFDRRLEEAVRHTPQLGLAE